MSATEDRKKAEDPKFSALQASTLVSAAIEKEARLRKLSEKNTYRFSLLRRLLKWMRAKFTIAEVVSNISALEAEVRCKLIPGRG